MTDYDHGWSYEWFWLDQFVTMRVAKGGQFVYSFFLSRTDIYHKLKSVKMKVNVESPYLGKVAARCTADLKHCRVLTVIPSYWDFNETADRGREVTNLSNGNPTDKLQLVLQLIQPGGINRDGIGVVMMQLG